MMIELTVKTLDSQNHLFSVEDDITVAQFKEKIAEKINIPPETQRIIYCGRVLKDDVKLNEYDVNGKVVHLVQRAPPTGGPASARTASPQRRNVRGGEHGMYVGSMAFPTNIMESQGIVPPPPTHSLAGSRLNVAKRMFRRAEVALNLLENPQSRPSEPPPADEAQEEVTPVLEARVIVPGPHIQDEFAEVLREVDNALFQHGGQISIVREGDSATPRYRENTHEMSETPSQNSVDTDTPPMHSASSTPDGASPVSASRENLTAEAAAAAAPTTEDSAGDFTRSATEDSASAAAGSSSAQNGGIARPSREAGATASGSSSGSNTGNSGLAENASRTSEMAELLDTLGRLQLRLAPFLEQYQNFMRQDLVVAPEDIRKTQTMINRVSEILHFLGHAYHSLSDIIVRVRTPPPRPLLCRPILIQHSAVVQTGFPIQVEAQINISPENLQAAANATPTSTNATNSQQTSATSTPTNTSSATPASASSAENTGGSTPHMEQRVFELPFIPSSVRVQSFPLEIRSFQANMPGMPSGGSGWTTTVRSGSNGANNTNNNSARGGGGNAASNAEGNAANAAPAAAGAAAAGTGGQQQNGAQPPAPGGGNGNNPNFDFYMEVTPESITIDSLETTVLRPNQAGDMIRGVLNPTAAHDSFNSFMQMVGQFMARPGNPAANNNGNPPTTASPPTPRSAAPATTTPSTAQQTSSATASADAAAGQNGASSSSVNAATPRSGQNSQARGNTQTHPTTATHTRSTARPHVHLAQHALQGGFDPFLPCNSHHISSRRPRLHPRNAAPNGNAGRTEVIAPGLHYAGPALNPNPIYSIVQGIVNSFRNAYNRTNRGQGQATSGANPQQQQQQQQQQQGTTTAAPGNSTAGNLGSGSAGGQMPAQATQGARGGEGGQGSSILGMPIFPQLQNAINNMSDSRAGLHGLTVAQILHQPDFDEMYVEGASIFSDLIVFLARNLTIGDLIHLNVNHVEPLIRIRGDLRNFVLNRVLEGNSSHASIERAVQRFIAEIQPFLNDLGNLEVRDNIDIIRSSVMLLKHRLPTIISLAASRNPMYVRLLLEHCVMTIKQLCALIIHASVNGIQGLEEEMECFVRRHTQGMPAELESWILMIIREKLRRSSFSIDFPEHILQPFIVRHIDSLTSTGSSLVNNSDSPMEEPMELDGNDVASGSSSELPTSTVNLQEDTEPLPQVEIGSEAWHNQVPAEWVPIIVRDTQRQRRQNPQPAFSDAYLSGMPSKRRKIVTSPKPQGSLPQVIQESVRRAVTTSALESVAPIEVVAQAAAADLGVQSAYRELLRSSVQSTLQNNEDFTPERYPNASNYFSKPQ